jgi:polysaccharide export outer membrane protein
VLALVAALVPFGVPPAHADDPVTGNGRPVYEIGIGDRLVVFVYEEDSREECLVRPDGNITLPLIGDVQAAGRTPEDLTAEIRERLTKFQEDPTVSVTVAEVNSYRIYLLGKIATPSQIESVSPLRLLQAIAIAGGPTEFANGKVIILRDRPGGGQERIEIDYDDILKGRAPEKNIWLRANDVLSLQ